MKIKTQRSGLVRYPLEWISEEKGEAGGKRKIKAPKSGLTLIHWQVQSSGCESEFNVCLVSHYDVNCWF